MRLSREAAALGAAVLAGATALGAAGTLAADLRARAARFSHEQPDAPAWWAPPDRRTPEVVARGRKLFLNSCAHCHGVDARGDEGPDLHGIQVSDRYIANTIRRGIKGEMPAFAKKHGPADISALLAYVRSLPVP